MTDILPEAKYDPKDGLYELDGSEDSEGFKKWAEQLKTKNESLQANNNELVGEPPLILNVNQLLEAGNKEVEWLVKNIIPENTINVFAGSPGSYKSALSMTLALQGGEGKPFLEKFITKKFSSLFIDMEAGIIGLSMRLKQLVKGHNIKEFNTQFMVDEVVTLDYPDVGYNMLAPVIKEHNVKVVIIDAVVRAMAGDENSASDVRKIFQTLNRLRSDFDVSFILIHHLSKHNNSITLDSLRGSGDFGAQADTVWGLSANKNGVVTVSCLKNRYLPLHQIQPYNVEVKNPGGDLDNIYFDFKGVKEKEPTAAELAGKHLETWLAKSKIQEFSIKQAVDHLQRFGCNRNSIIDAVKRFKEKGDVFQPRARGTYHVNRDLVDWEDVE